MCGLIIWLSSKGRSPLFAAVAALIVLTVNCDIDLDKRREESLMEVMGGCEFPKLDPFAPEVMKFEKTVPGIVCRGTDWVFCRRNECRVRRAILHVVFAGVECTYRDILLLSNNKYMLGQPTVLVGEEVYRLIASDHAEVTCHGNPGNRTWEGVVIGYREVEVRRPSPGLEGSHNIIVLAFDSASKNGFIRRMPDSYQVLQDELGAVILNGYNIVGEETTDAMFPILTGHTESELMSEVQRDTNNRAHLDDLPFLWHPLAAAGYRTAYFEDSPWIDPVQSHFTGFSHQPTDHYLSAFFKHYKTHLKRFSRGNGKYCLGDTPTHELLLNIMHEFMTLDKRKKLKRFVFTSIADITQDNFNMISNADEGLVNWLRAVSDNGVLIDTSLVIMGDHGARYSSLRNTLQRKQEERLPLMALVVAKRWARERPEAMRRLHANVDVLTTPFDVHSTLLELAGLKVLRVPLVLPGAGLPRSMSLFDEIPENRTCSEAGIEPQWCTCLKWEDLPASEEMYRRAGEAFLNYINELTRDVRSNCAARTLKSIEFVSQQMANEKLLAHGKSKDFYGYQGSFDDLMYLEWRHYKIKVTVNPGKAMYEALLSYNKAANKFRIMHRDIARVNAYKDESSCVSAARPDLSMYCYCHVKKPPKKKLRKRNALKPM